MQSNQEMFILRLLASAGLNSIGRAALKKIKPSRNGRTIDITLTVSCARSSDMDPITEVDQLPLRNKPSSPSLLSSTSNLNTFERFLPTLDGTAGLKISSVELDSWLTSLGGSAGSLVVEMIHQPSGKRLRMTLREVSPTS